MSESNNKNVFIVGAGFSCDLANLPVLGALSAEVISSINNECYNGNSFFQSLQKCVFDTPELVRSNIEFLMTMFRGNGPWLDKTHVAIRNGMYPKLVNLVAEIIRQHESQAQINSAVEPEMNSLIDFWQENKSSVITFNYDTLIERCFSNKFSSENNFIGPSELYVGPLTNVINRTDTAWGRYPTEYFKLIKLHGSINWYYSGNDDLASEPIYFDPMFKTSDPENVSSVERNKMGLYPMIVPPLLDKDPFLQNSILRLQWEAAHKAIAEANNIFVIGYSMPVTDLMAKFLMMESNFRSKAKWHVFLHQSDASRVQTRFTDIFGAKVSFLEMAKNESSVAKLMSYLRSYIQPKTNPSSAP